MAISLQGVGSTPAAVLACTARESKTTEVVIDKPEKVVYRTTHTKETGWTDTAVSILGKILDIGLLLGKTYGLSF